MVSEFGAMEAARRPVAVLAALHQEAAALAARLSRAEAAPGRLSVWSGELEGEAVALVLTGVGKVSAAAATQAVCDGMQPLSILSIGLAGGVASGTAQGAVVVATAAIQHDFDARPLTSGKGWIPGFGEGPFIADAGIGHRLARAAASVVGPSRVRSGLVLTGDQIVSSGEVRDGIVRAFPDGACFEMETAAVAQVARQNGIPWGGVRIISDSADESFDLEHVLGFGTGTAAELFESMIRAFLMDERR